MDNVVCFEYNGEKYSANRLKHIIDFYNSMKFKGGDIYCPLCGCDLDENGLFVCEKCHEILDVDEQCHMHDGKYCRSCCPECCGEAMYEWEQEHRGEV